MTDIPLVHAVTPSRTQPARRHWLTPRLSRLLMAMIVIGAVGLGFVLTDAPATSRAVADAGIDLIRLLRFMAVIKGALALGAVAALFWRLGSGVSSGRFVAYGACCAAMVAGPGLIWGMAHVGLGALLLHGGLIVLLVLLWRDPEVPVRLEAALASRRGSRRGLRRREPVVPSAPKRR